jgi:hypothetical protein
MTIRTLFVLLSQLAILLGAEDVIILDNGQRIAGTVVAEPQADDRMVSIHTGTGLMRFDHRRIVKLELCYASRRALVKDNDLKGLIELARWCRSKGMNIEALELLEKAMALPGVDDATKALYLRMVDEIRGPEVALPLYKAYRDMGGRDPDTIKRLEQLEKVKADFDAQYGGAAAAAPRIDFAKEGLETRAWMPESPQYFNPVEVQRVMLDGDDPTAALQITCKAGTQDKAAVRLSMAASTNQHSRFCLSVANQGRRPIDIGIAVKTGSRYVYHESEPVTVEASGKFKRLIFNLKDKTWKSEASGWQNNIPLAEGDQIREIQILFHNGKQDAKLVVDGVGFQGIKDL